MSTLSRDTDRRIEGLSRTGSGWRSVRPVMPPRHVPLCSGLDVVRFLAAMWVMLSHADAVRGGSHAVALFFVLSGYLIGGQLVCEKLAAQRHSSAARILL